MPERLQIGSLFDRYRVVSKIGAGGMGEVYLAEDTRLGRRVALKVLPEDIASDSQRLSRFEQEARAASGLNHPNILTVFEFGNVDSVHYLATELVEGQTLRQVIDSNELSIPSAVTIAEQIAFALSAAHAAGIIHRDLKPDNVMVRRDGIVKVLDFGLAKLLDTGGTAPDTEAETRAIVKTNPGAVMGTAAYMSPEQARGKQADGRSDIWSLGAVLYEMVTGRMPFEGENSNEVIAAILKTEPSVVARWAVDVPHELERIIGKCLRKDPEERYQHVKDLWLDLKDLRQDLEMNAKLERSTAPNRGDAAHVTGDSQSHQVPTNAKLAADTHSITGEKTQSASSAEYLVSEIKQHKTGVFAALALVLIAALGIAFWLYRGGWTSPSGQINSLAVLPFENGSGDPGMDYLSDGLSESLIDKLSQLPQLKVIARTSSFKYRGPDVDIQDVAKKLGVQAIVMGKVLRQGDQLSVRVEMIDAYNNKQLWGEQYNQKMSDVAALQQQIAQTVSEKLRLKLSGAQEQQLAKSDNVNPKAYELRLMGRYYGSLHGTENEWKSLQFLEQAVAIDPGYALGYADLSLRYGATASQGLADPKIYRPKAESAARRAIELDPNLPDGHVALARFSRENWHWEEADAEYKRALELDSNNARAHGSYGNLLCFVGRCDEGLAQVRRAQELDPLGDRGGLGYALVWARRYDEAINELKRVIEQDRIAAPYTLLGYAYAGKGMYKDAIAAVQQAIQSDKDNSSNQIYLGAYYAEAGETDKARTILKQLQTTKEYVSPAELAILYTSLDDKDAAFASLEKAFQEHDLQLQFLKVELQYDSLRDDPRFTDLLRRVGLPTD